MSDNRCEFIDRTGLLVADLADAVLEDGPIRPGLGGKLWWYDRGVYRRDGEHEVAKRTKLLLGNRWRRAHAENVVGYIAAGDPFIGDANPTRWVNTRTGLVDWSTGEIHDHDPDVATTFQVPHEWDPQATCPTVDRWLAEVLPDDAIGFVWTVLGYLLYADNPLHRAILLYGTGRNGKGTLLRLATGLVGIDNISNVTLQALGENRFVAAELFGKVANIAGDLDGRSIRQTDVFKMVTGGDRITAEQKYANPFTFTCRAKFMFAANELPGSSDLTEGYFARWLVVPFAGYFPEGIADPTLEPRLHAELPGVLVKATMALADLMDRGAFDVPTSVLAATADYRTKADPVRQFVAERLVIDSDGREARTAVYDAYKSWCDDCGHRPVPARKFYDRLPQLHAGIAERKTAGIRMLLGCRFRTDDDDHGAGLGQVGQETPLSPPTHGGKGRKPALAAPRRTEPAPALDGKFW